MIDFLINASLIVIGLASAGFLLIMLIGYVSSSKDREAFENSTPLDGEPALRRRVEGVTAAVESYSTADGTPVANRRLAVSVRYKTWKSTASMPIFNKTSGPDFALDTAFGSVLIKTPYFKHRSFKKFENLSESARSRIMEELPESPEILLRRLLPELLIKLNPGMSDAKLEILEEWTGIGETLCVVGPMHPSNDPRFVGIFDWPNLRFMAPYRPAVPERGHTAKMILLIAIATIICLASWGYWLARTHPKAGL